MAAPAEPFLASAVWAAHLAEASRDVSDSAPKRRKAATGHREINAAFDSGLDFGDLCCISAEAHAGSRELSQELLVSHLVDSVNTTATFIDTSHACDVRRLHKAIRARLLTRSTDDHADAALAILDRLKIMKVFDFVGLTESVTELRDTLEGELHSGSPSYDVETDPKATIGDSEDGENEVIDLTTPSAASATSKQHPQQDPASKLHMLLIDNIDQIASPLLKSNLVHGQALLTSLIRSLAHLTRTHHLCTVVLNNATPLAHTRADTPSIFSSCAVRPALGKASAFMFDLHLLVHRIPRRSAHGKEAYAESGVVGNGELVDIVEVLHDRHGGRLGRWAPFWVDQDGNLVSVA